MAERDVDVLAPLASDQSQRLGADPAGDRSTEHLPHTDKVQQRLRTEEGKALYARRGRTVEPVFGQDKMNLDLARMRRRGLGAVRRQVRFTAAVHNMTKITRRVCAAGLSLPMALAAGGF
ncbi:Transposase DDE domain-containing protein [Quadrisphaera granulorum]|uniref:DDE family transposase n=1 Tax=Quadrisphaera granulorum TaxID=317664 RepID=A0A315ZLT0_9ACTN|nr:transposase [Quadrisphaera granulorum]PWJ46476.1 DDE family transposase [Quadrisphaera granulorum]SZE99034.1 Transposase DDE domain-containing protein [Quadrisphaera granulorum]